MRQLQVKPIVQFADNTNFNDIYESKNRIYATIWEIMTQ